jgi:membrane-bound metal-dependent hydrolase YbcI (DUF457 family)
MCLGHTHAISGAVVGAAIGEFPLHLGPAGIVTLAGFTAAFATLPDLDTRHSCAARSLGFFSAGFAFLVGKVSGGHRHGTHSILGVAVFTALAWAACVFRHAEHGRIRFVLAVFLALAFAAGLRALRIGGHWADLLAIAGAVFIAWHGWSLALIPLACALGCAAHLAGDSLTVEGIPLFWPFTLRHFRLLPPPLAFVTGTWRENVIVAPALLLALAALAWHAAALAHLAH